MFPILRCSSCTLAKPFLNSSLRALRSVEICDRLIDGDECKPSYAWFIEWLVVRWLVLAGTVVRAAGGFVCTICEAAVLVDKMGLYFSSIYQNDSKYVCIFTYPSSSGCM